jgi:hypothetical protein
MNPKSIAGIQIPESKLANAARELVRDTESPLLTTIPHGSSTSARSRVSAKN